MENNKTIIDNNNQIPVVEEITQQGGKRKKKKILIVLLILAFFIPLSLFGFLLLINYSDFFDSNEIPPYADDNFYQSSIKLFVPLDNEKEILIENPPIGNEENQYRLFSDYEGGVIWKENEEAGSIVYYVKYYRDYKDLFGDGSLGSVNIDGKTYEYIKKVDGDEETGVGSGTIWSKEDIIDANGYKGYRIITYYNPPESEEIPSKGDFVGIGIGVNSISTAIVLDDIFPGIPGVLEFYYSAAQDSDCTSFPSDFKLTLRDNPSYSLPDYEE